MSIRREYAGERASELPLGSYAAFVGLFGVGLAALLARASRREPGRLGPIDAALTGLATHAITRVVTKDWVTAPLRAPFVRYEESAGGGEVRESSRGAGLRRAVGDLVTCPYCTGPWVALALAAGWLEAPRATRTVAWIFGAVAASNWLNRAYDALGAKHRELRARPAPEIRIVRVRTDEHEQLDDGQRDGVMTRHVEVSPDDVPEAID